MNGIAWGSEEYSAEQDAHSALRDTRRAGEPVCHDDSPALVEQVADALLNLQFKTWDFGDSVAFEALIAASHTLGEDRWERFAHGWGRAWATRSLPFARLDCTVPGRALVLIAERHDDRQLLASLSDLATYLRQRNRVHGIYETWTTSPLLAPYGDPAMSDRDSQLLAQPPAGVFLDCLHFDPPFFTALGRILGDDELMVDGVEQAMAYIRVLQRQDGLFDHFALEGHTETFGPGWGRGQGWAALGLLETITELRSHAGFTSDSRLVEAEALFVNAVAKLLTRMTQLQRPDGHWEVIVDRPRSGDEFSTAGFMAAAMRHAIDLGIGEKGVFLKSLQSARNAVLASLDADAQLREVSAAVYASTVPDHYAAVPRGYVVPWGQGPALLALISDSSTGHAS